MELIRHYFESLEDIQQNAKAGLGAIQEDDFEKCFQQLQDCWNKCICEEGRHLQED
jgi:hypothetical protein